MLRNWLVEKMSLAVKMDLDIMRERLNQSVKECRERERLLQEMILNVSDRVKIMDQIQRKLILRSTLDDVTETAE